MSLRKISILKTQQLVNENYLLTIMQADEIPNHHQCDFGKWYDNAPAELRSLPVFEEMGVHHEAVHKKVMEAVEHFNKKNSTAAEASLSQFEVERKNLFTKLHELYVS